MAMYYAVMVDETYCEFGAEVDASSLSDARSLLKDYYPECRISDICSATTYRERESDRYRRLEQELDYYG